ncbi:GNAT family N-acetyltransferase [Aeromonas sobria]|uniref:GNAT family N-acetyltransferase n=1 Tax=Aeromonas sobria TaxID=646 RepID=UPI00139698AD|nr:GNAT family N-acetyltransferase [Aeromonas sobria]
MTDPHNALIAFQEALLGGFIQPTRCPLHQDLSYFLDCPTTSPRITFALIDSNQVVKAIAMFAGIEPVHGSRSFAIGYAVAEKYRRQGLAHEIVAKSLSELSSILKGQATRIFIDAVVGVDNVPSQKVAMRHISERHDEITDEICGLPAFHYTRFIEC